jgi:hypothetical protein
MLISLFAKQINGNKEKRYSFLSIVVYIESGKKKRKMSLLQN